MVELALHENLDSIAVEKIAQPKGGHAIRVHMSFENTSEDLESALVENGFQHLSREAISLFSDDEVTRRYEPSEHFVLVRRA